MYKARFKKKWLIQSVAMFPSTYFYAHFGISHKKMLYGNAKMRINSKNEFIKIVCAQLSRINFLSDKKKCAYTTMETHLRNKFHHAHWKVMWLCGMSWNNLTSSGPISFTPSEMLFWSFWNAWGKSFKVFLYNYCLTWLRSQTAETSKSNDCIYCV